MKVISFCRLSPKKKKKEANLSFMLFVERQSQGQQKIEANGIYKQFRDACLISVISYTEKTALVEEGYRYFCI